MFIAKLVVIWLAGSVQSSFLPRTHSGIGGSYEEYPIEDFYQKSDHHWHEPSSVSYEGSRYIPEHDGFDHKYSNYIADNEMYGRDIEYNYHFSKSDNFADNEDYYSRESYNYPDHLGDISDSDIGRHISFKSNSIDHSFFKGERSEFRKSIRKYSDEDILTVEEPLLRNETLTYDVMSKCPHGRHLLMITLLEGFDKDCWKPRCMGHIQYYLPESLRSSSQPTPPASACQLKEIRVDGKLQTRKDIMDIYRKSPTARITPEKQFSRFHADDVAAVDALAKLALTYKSFDSLLSFLVVVKEVCNRQVFIETVMLIIQARNDLGFVVPSLQSIKPESFFPPTVSDEKIEGNLAEPYEPEWSGKVNPVRTFSFKTTHRTLPVSDPESHLWHLREDIMVNSIHGTWHVLVSDPNAPFVMKRRGELFYHMHKQMLTRYNCDRLAIGMNPVPAYGEEEWSKPILKGYNSLLGPRFGNNMNLYAPREDFKRLTDEAIITISGGAKIVDECIRRMRINNTRMGYSNGIDHGISILGDLMEPYPDHGETGGGLIHNYGHVQLSQLSIPPAPNGGRTGVMDFAETAVRDPVFFKWHTYVDNFFKAYKEKLGPYTDRDLSLPGVEILSVSAHSAGKRNMLRTFTDFATLELDANLLSTMNGTIMRYERLNHDPYLFSIRINSRISEGAVGRIFLVPSKVTKEYDMNDFVVEMDKFYIELNKGTNTITRRAEDSPLFTPGPPSLRNLQRGLITGMSETEFNWANCGWPTELALPRGNSRGQKFELVVMITKLLPTDKRRMEDWMKLSQTAWGLCGMRQGEGSMPDSRPMGFPFDRPGNLKGIMGGRSNMKSAQVVIHHTG